MLGIFIVQLPFSVCAVWCLILLSKRHKNLSDRLVVWGMGLLAVSLYCGSMHMDINPNYNRLAIGNVILQFSSLAVFPIICLYIRSCYEDYQISWVPYLSTLPSLILLLISIALTSVIGIGRSGQLIEMLNNSVVPRNLLSRLDKAYILFTFHIYFVTFFISLCISLIYVFAKLFTGKFKFKHIASFLRGEKSSFVANVICLFFVIYFILWAVSVIFGSVICDTLSVWSVVWSLTAAVVLFLIGYVTTVPALPGGYINLDRLRHPFSTMHQSTQEYLQGIDSGPMAGVATSGYDKIMDSFKRYMINERGYLNPSLTIEEIARVLNTNRTYVSKLVNIYFGKSFRDYLSSLRLDYAKQLMKDEPDASLDYIAVKSGFQSSTQFIRKFREVEGVTPTVWKTAQRTKR